MLASQTVFQGEVVGRHLYRELPDLLLRLDGPVCFLLFLSQDEFPGLLPLVRMYVNSVDIDVDTRCTILQYLRFISKKASGT